MNRAATGRAVKLKALHSFLFVLLSGMLAASLRSETTSSTPQYLVDSWRSDRGLPENTVTGVAQTPDGYLWASTLDGMARFDGARFKVFNAGSTPALGSGRIRFLFTGREGALWVCTQEGGVIKFHNGQFTPLPLPEAEGIRPAVTQVAEEESGALWLSMEDGQVWHLADDIWTVVSTNWAPVSQTGYQVRADQQGRPWAISDSGLYRAEASRVVPVLQGKPGDYVVLCPALSGGWWIKTGSQVRLWREGQWLTTVQGPPGTNPPPDLRACMEDRSGRLWLGVWGLGLFSCDTHGSTLQFTRQSGLEDDFTRALFEDSESNLWVGLQGGGLCRLHTPLIACYGLAPGLSWEWISSVTEDNKGEIWVGTDGYGLNRLQGNVILPCLDQPANSPSHIMSAIADRQGEVWLGTRTGGLFRWKDGKLTRPVGFTSNNLLTRSLYEDSQGAIWVGWRNTDQLGKIQDGTLHYIALPKLAGLVDVRVMAEDSSGALWFGTDGNGLYRLKDGQFTLLTKADGLGSDFIWALHPEADGALWIGTYGGGLTRLKHGRAATCTTRQGLADDVICYMADDGKGRYWFSSHQGIFRVSKQELNSLADGIYTSVQCVAYGKADGLPTLECKGGYQPAGCRSRDGRLWFPTIGGLAVVNPAQVGASGVAPRVYIEEILVDGNATVLEPRPMAGRSETQNAQWNRFRGFEPPPSSLAVPAGSRRLEFRYAGLNFSESGTLRFRHKLEGVDAEWVETDGPNAASYNNLTHGTYTFRAQACTRDGVWGRGGDAVTFTVLPFYWQTWWFMGVFLVTFGGIVAWTVGLAMRRRHRRHLNLVRQLHASERARTQIARDIHDDLGSSLTEIGLLGALAARETTPPAEARQQTARMMARAEELARKLDETVWAVNPKNDSLKHLATYLCHLAREFLEPTAIRCRLDVAADLPDTPLTAEVRHHLFLAAKEAINNAVKHSGASELWLRMRVGEGVFNLEIEDNGRGVPAEATGESGNGLRNMAARMEEIGGEYQLVTAPAGGTTVRLRLRLALRHEEKPGVKPQLREAGTTMN
jgi:signal transduction histidine kinase/ligand-binding sensor domain-containing protein